jgi:hypothetical protein
MHNTQQQAELALVVLLDSFSFFLSAEGFMVWSHNYFYFVYFAAVVKHVVHNE